MADYNTLIAKSKELAAAGRMDEARRVAEIALKSRGSGQERSFMQRLGDNLLPDDNPDNHNFGETVAAAINKAGEAVTFGLIGDEADARVKSWLPFGGSYEDELAKNRQQEEVLERDNPGTALAADVMALWRARAAQTSAQVMPGRGLHLVL